MGRAWMTAAVCHDPDLGVDFLAKPPALQRVTCDTCPVWVECLDYAIDTQATSVVMGGVQIRDRPIRRLDQDDQEVNHG